MLDTDASLPAVDNTAASPALLRQRGSNHVGLRQFNERLAQVVECRYFGGYTDAETAQALGVTTRTVQRDWLRARAWLYQQLNAR